MSKQEHFWLRLAAVAVIAAAHWLPHASAVTAQAHPASQPGAQATLASVAR